MTVIEHLEALRWALIWIVAGWAAATVFSWFFADGVYAYIIHRANLPGDHVVCLTPTCGFFIKLKVALYVGFVIASPLIIQQSWSFVAPGLYLHERRLFGPVIVATLFFFLLGMGFALFALPLIMHVLLGFSVAGVIQPLLAADELLGFVLGLVIGFGLVFELPVVLYALGRMGIISSRWLWKNRPYWIIGLGLLANFLTPGGDPLTPMIMFAPLYVFYEGAALLLRLSGR